MAGYTTVAEVKEALGKEGAGIPPLVRADRFEDYIQKRIDASSSRMDAGFAMAGYLPPLDFTVTDETPAAQALLLERDREQCSLRCIDGVLEDMHLPGSDLGTSPAALQQGTSSWTSAGARLEKWLADLRGPDDIGALGNATYPFPDAALASQVRRSSWR